MKRIRATFTILAVIYLTALLMHAQTTAFAYQGSLKDGANLANGNYDFEFALYDGSGIQLGATLARNGVSVANGSFSVSLDFGNQFPGSGRFLEVRVRLSGGGGFTTLAPRQPINSSPYSVKSLSSDSAANFNASLTGDVTGTQNATAIASNAVTTTKLADSSVTTQKLADSAVTATRIANGQVVRSVNGLTDGVVLSAGSNITITPSGNFLTIASTGGAGGSAILNQTSPQAGANFNVTGTGTANVFNAVAQYNINGAGRILSSPGSNNLFAGIGSGLANTTGSGNTFVGGGAGGSNTTSGSNSFLGANAGTFNTGSENSFFGAAAGFSNTTGIRNSFFGATAGQSNTTGNNNAFFGWTTGQFSTGSNNSFFGARAGQSNTSGSENSFVGESAGRNNTIGGGNAFFGKDAGQNNTEGSSNSFFGKSAGLATTKGSTNSFVGANAGQFNSTGSGNSFFGTAAGFSNTTGTSNAFFGSDAGRLNTVGAFNSFFGTSAGQSTTSSNNVFVGGGAGASNTSGGNNSFFGPFAGNTNTVGNSITIIGNEADVAFNNLQYATAIGARSTVSTSNTVALGRASGSDAVVIYGIAGFGTFHLCINSSNQVAGCSSSLRYKKNIGRYSPGMSFVNQLRPISYDWRDTGMKDVGFGAEDIEKIDPRFVTYNKAGQVEGVKYDRLSVAFVNAFKEQESQIEALQKANAMLMQRLSRIEKNLTTTRARKRR